MSTTYSRRAADASNVTFAKPPAADDWFLDGLTWFVGGVVHVLAGIPVLGLSVIAAGVSLWWSREHGWLLPLVGLGLLVAALVTLRFLSPRVFEAVVGDPVISSWRKTLLFERWWQPAMVCSGLAYRPGGRQEALPQLRTVHSHRGVDEVRVRMLPGQTVADFGTQAEGLANTFKATDCRVRSVPRKPQHVDLTFIRRDPLARDFAAPECPETVGDLAALPIGVDERSRPALVPGLYASTLIAGESGAGKSSAIWAYLAALAPAIRSGLVEVWAIDAKGGMELAMGRGLFRHVAYGEADGTAWQGDIADLLDDAVVAMQHRQARLRGVTRKHVPTRAEPLIVVLIDELAAITAYVTDNACKKRIVSALGMLLSQGRAPGVSVIAATQDPRKEVVQMRDLFTHRIALRTAEAETADLVLGDGARARGAQTHRIAESTPGVAYLVADGQPEPVRFRFFHLDDTAIASLSDHVRSPLTELRVIDDRPQDAA